MLFPGQGNVPPRAMDRLVRTYNRLRREGVPLEAIQLTLRQQIAALAGGSGIASYGVGKIFERVVNYDGSSFRNWPSSARAKRTREPTSTPPNKQPRMVQPRLRAEPMEVDDGVDNSKALVATASAERSGQSTRLGGIKGSGETPISPYDFVQIGIPKVATTKLPFRKILKKQSVAAKDRCLTYAVRMNSIYDILGDATYTADPSAVADTTTGTVETPKWRAYFADKYQYYSVLGCDYKVSFRIRPETAGAYPKRSLPVSNDFAVYKYECGLQRPPNEIGSVLIPHAWKILHTGVEYKKLPGPKFTTEITATDGVPGTSSWEANTQGWTTFQGHVGVGDIKHEVTEDELQQRWHKMTEVPPTPELLVFHIQEDEFYSNSDTGDYELDVIIEVTYLTQFKDIKAQYQYPTQATAFAAIANTALAGQE